jgi:hypothetical protein
MVLNASLKLFCLPCLLDGVCAAPFMRPYFMSLRGCHLPSSALPFCSVGGFGLGVRDELTPNGSSSCVGSRSGWKAGNLKVACGGGSTGDADAIAATAREYDRGFFRPWARRRWVRQAELACAKPPYAFDVTATHTAVHAISPVRLGEGVQRLEV